MVASTRVIGCRSCRHTRLEGFLDLGTTPLADRLVKDPEAGQKEPRFPLQLAFCPECSLVQILETVSPSLLYQEDYPYYSSVSPTLKAHTRENVDEVLQRWPLSQDSLVIEPASNDGYLLEEYHELGIPVLGIDPAEGPAGVAVARGIPTLNTFLTESLADSLAEEGKRADILHANNVLAHVADTNGFVRAIRRLIKADGRAIIEVPYLRDLVAECEFDTIYHEHLCYFSLTALDHLFSRHGLAVNEVRRLPIHGGSLRLTVSHLPWKSPKVRAMLAEEALEGMNSVAFYTDFQRKVEKIREDLRQLLWDLKGKGHSIAAYGAAAKGSTLINFVGIGPDLVDFVADKNPHKHGLFMPGQHLPIIPADELAERRPDFVVLLAWNFTDEIIEQQRPFLEAGGRFIRPVPTPEIL